MHGTNCRDIVRVLRDSPESRKVPFVPYRGTNGIGTIQKNFGTGQTGRDNTEKTNVPNFVVSIPKCVGFRFLFITNMFVFK